MGKQQTQKRKQQAAGGYGYGHSYPHAYPHPTISTATAALSNLEKLANATFGGNRKRLEHYANLLLREDLSGFTAQKDQHRRRLAGRASRTTGWNPHHKSLVPSHYLYGYDGSLTEPPCAEIVSWFVVDTPMKLSRRQLEQMKTILFANVDETCRETSVHYQRSVARPIQETGGNRDVWHCTRDNFLPDKERTPAS